MKSPTLGLRVIDACQEPDPAMAIVPLPHSPGVKARALLQHLLEQATSSIGIDSAIDRPARRSAGRARVGAWQPLLPLRYLARLGGAATQGLPLRRPPAIPRPRAKKKGRGVRGTALRDFKPYVPPSPKPVAAG